MTNEKLGVLLVDVPEPSYFKYYLVQLVEFRKKSDFRYNLY